ncbi:MAG: FeoA family protein [Pyrinomonadaceae bacterium]
MSPKSSELKMITLRNVPVGSSARVVSVRGNSRIAKRLMEMGVIPGISLKVVKTAPFGDPIEVRLRGYSLAMRKSEADSIEVSF